MTPSASIFVWFDPAPLPEILPDPAVVLGGTGLLPEFVNRVASSGGGSLSLAVPFVGSGIGHDLRGLANLCHDRLTLLLVTNSRDGARAAFREVGSLPWQSLQIRMYNRLHAKIYAFLTPTGGGASLVGSHNLSRGGARRNDEAGVLFVSTTDPDCNRLIQVSTEQVRRLSRKARPFIDTMRWPAEQAS